MDGGCIDPAKCAEQAQAMAEAEALREVDERAHQDWDWPDEDEEKR
jgi:hypothetical protein